MSRYNLYIAAVSVAFLVALGITPLIRRLAVRLDLVDCPDRHRKLHERPTALGGGLAVLVAFLASLVVVLFLSQSQQAVFAQDRPFLVGMILASLLIVLVGLMDDRFGMRGRQKLLGQLLAGLIVVGSGLVIEDIRILSFDVHLGLLAVPFTLFWIVGAINALNLIDGMDGLATSVGIVLSLAIGVIAAMTTHRTEAFLAFAMAGALLAFFIFNSPPASIFLGDAGSMLIGLILGTLAIRGSFKGPATAALAAPVAIWAIPVFDVSMAILRRRLTGRTIFTVDRGHLHHSLQRIGLSNRWTVLVVGLLCSITAVASVVSVFMNADWFAYATVGAVLSVLVMFRVFGHVECVLVLKQLKNLSFSLVPRLEPRNTNGRVLETRFQGNGQWEDLWETLTEFAERFDLSSVQLNVSLPAANEDYHVTWHRHDVPHDALQWHSDIPLIADDVTVGRLRIAGERNNGSVCTWMGDLITGLKPFESQMLDLLSDYTTTPTATPKPSHAVPAT